MSPVDRTEVSGAEGVDAGAVVAGVPSQVGREVGADTVKVGLPTPAVSPVDRTEGAGAEGVDAGAVVVLFAIFTPGFSVLLTIFTPDLGSAVLLLVHVEI